MNLEKLTYEEMVEYGRRLKTTRDDYKKCPAQRESNGKFYCSFIMPCEEYCANDMIWIEEKPYCKCKFIEREGSGPRKI